MNNITESIAQKRLKKLHNNPAHPLCQLKLELARHFSTYDLIDDKSEVVSTKANFDDLLINLDHPSRSPSDTYYVDENHVLRTATSAHQTELMRSGYRQVLVVGDVYRKDTIDKTHYPVFHQVEGLKIMPSGDARADLLNTLEGMIQTILPGIKYRILDDYFPFTQRSLEIEVWYNGDWLEILGAGVIQPKILKSCGIQGTGWAFGIGLDRLLMAKCAIPDIRYLWSEDPRFISQYEGGLVKFEAYSKYPPSYRDISFWVNNYQEDESDNCWDKHKDFCSMIRELSGDLIESIEQVDLYRKENRTSLAYRICYRSPDRTLLNEEINQIQEAVRDMVVKRLKVILR